MKLNRGRELVEWSLTGGRVEALNINNFSTKGEGNGGNYRQAAVLVRISSVHYLCFS